MANRQHLYRGKRKPNDYYATDPYAIDILLKDGKAKLNKDVWECACGAGHLSERLKKYEFLLLYIVFYKSSFGKRWTSRFKPCFNG